MLSENPFIYNKVCQGDNFINLKNRYLESGPYPHAVLDGVFENKFLI